MKLFVFIFCIFITNASALAHEQFIIERSIVDKTVYLPESFTEIDDFSVVLDIKKKSYLLITGHIDTAHSKHKSVWTKPLMVAFQVMHNGRWLPGSKTGENIYGVKDHYYSAQIHGYAVLEPGKHHIKIFGRSASTAAKKVNGLASIKKTYNQVLYRVIEF